MAAILLALGCQLGAGPAPAASARTKYLLRSNPKVGQRIAYEQSTDTTLSVTADAGGNVRATQIERSHEQTVVTCEEILQIGKPPEITKRVTFGPGCWSATKTNDKPTRTVRSIYADKTVTFVIFDDGVLEQDFGIRPSKAQMQRMKNMFIAAADLYPDHPVAVGERWRADRAMNALLDLSPNDTSSTIFTLKEIREVEGRPTAVVAVTAGVIKAHPRGFNLELSLEGTWQIDLETGAELKIDLVGRSTIAAGIAPRGQHAAAGSVANVSGGGTFAMHRAARLLPPEVAADAPGTTQPAAAAVAE